MYFAFPLFPLLPFRIGRADAGNRSTATESDAERDFAQDFDHEAEREALFVNVWALAPQDPERAA